MLNPIEAVEAKEELKRWLAKKSPAVKALAGRWPYGSRICHYDGDEMYVIGYSDDAALIIVSPIVPWRWEDKREAIQRSIYLSAEAASLGSLKIVDRRAA